MENVSSARARYVHLKGDAELQSQTDERRLATARVDEVISVSKKPWRLFCSHGAVLFYIAQHPGCTVREIANALVLTHRTVWGLIGDLKRAGLAKSRREGKNHYYTINGAGRFPDPVICHLTLAEALSAIAAENAPAE
jgi:DNA-binding transcriptional ArsR family regulator